MGNVGWQPGKQGKPQPLRGVVGLYIGERMR